MFLLDWLIEGRGGYLETNPSTSPEHMFIDPDGKPASVSYSSTMDMSIIKEVFSAIISAAEVYFFFSVTHLGHLFLFFSNIPWSFIPFSSIVSTNKFLQYTSDFGEK